MTTYLEALDGCIHPESPSSERDRLLIWLAAINNSLPPGKHLGDTEIQKLVNTLAGAKKHQEPSPLLLEELVLQTWGEIKEIVKEVLPPWEKRKVEWVRNRVCNCLDEFYDFAYDDGWTDRQNET